MKFFKVPDEAVRRLPIYLRGALRLSLEGTKRISSAQLADYIGFNAWQIRKDFSYFGGLGTRGVGYDVETLIVRLRKILKLNKVRGAALVGAGNLGSALLRFDDFSRFGVQIVYAFDSDPRKIGRTIGRVEVEPVAKLTDLSKRHIDLAIITVPQDVAQEIADTLVTCGIRGILSFSPGRLVIPKKVTVKTIDIAMDLAGLPYYLPNRTKHN
ncbi:redox-sensing transcriptional repressor Rex [Planctomycetota bacterium]